eukprot:3457310-Amphidinium_carterae.1
MRNVGFQPLLPKAPPSLTLCGTHSLRLQLETKVLSYNMPLKIAIRKKNSWHERQSAWCMCEFPLQVSLWSLGSRGRASWTLPGMQYTPQNFIMTCNIVATCSMDAPSSHAINRRGPGSTCRHDVPEPDYSFSTLIPFCYTVAVNACQLCLAEQARSHIHIMFCCCCSIEETPIEITTVGALTSSTGSCPGKAPPLDEGNEPPSDREPLSEEHKREYIVQLVREDGQRLGLVVGELKQEPGQAYIREVKPGGLAEKWNNENPANPLIPGWELVSVNGVTGYTGTRMEAGKPGANKLVMLVREPRSD